MLKKLGRQHESVLLLPMFGRRGDAFRLKPIDDFRRVQRAIGLDDGVDIGRGFLRRDAGRSGAFLCGEGIEPPPQSEDQDGEGCGAERDVDSVHEASCVGGRRGITGRVTMHVVPFPSWLSILMSPPNFLMMRRATVRPSPDPSPCPLVVKKGSKTLDRCCFGMPGPESAIVVTTDVSVSEVKRDKTPRPFMA